MSRAFARSYSARHPGVILSIILRSPLTPHARAPRLFDWPEGVHHDRGDQCQRHNATPSAIQVETEMMSPIQYGIATRFPPLMKRAR